MKITKIAAPLLTVFVLGAGMTACNTGTDPGETNTERSDIEYPEEGDNAEAGTYKDTTAEYEEVYEGREGTAIGDSAYNQEGKRDKRYDDNKKQ
jgi:hypothetical protein